LSVKVDERTFLCAFSRAILTELSRLAKRGFNKKVIVAILLVAAGVGFLIYRGLDESKMYYLEVSETLRSAEALAGNGIRVAGMVMPGTISYDQKNLLLTFSLRDKKGGDSLRVRYRGVIPDAFKPDREVVVEGVFDKDEGVIVATTLLVKCPSKYSSENS
jgi:cytochrome c-type biogenesis protein CcmE